MKDASAIVGLLLAIVCAGCATTSKIERVTRATDTRQTADFTLAAVSAPAQENSQSSSVPYHFTSARQPAAPQHESHSEGEDAGREFQRLPPVPAAPEAIDINQRMSPRGEPLTLEMLQSLACANNPTLLQAQAQVEGELGKAIQAGLWPNPTLSYVQEQIGVEGTPGEFVGGTVRQRIVTGHKLDLSRSKFLARTRAAEWHALEQQYRVLNDVRIHYFRTRGRQELVRIHRDLLKSAEDNVLTTREQYNVGQATLAEVHLANAALQRARLDLLMNENAYRQAFEELASLVGVDLTLSPLATPLEGDVTPIDWDEALQRLYTQSPQINAALNKLEADRIAVTREIVEPIPDIVVEGGVGRNFEAGGTTAQARISVEVPFFDWNQGTIRQAEADYARQQGELRRMELTLKRGLARTYGDYLTALQHVQNYEQVIVPETRQAYELQLRSYKADRIAWDEVLKTQQDYFMVQAEYARQLIAWREAEVMIVGFLLHDGLRPPTDASPPGHINAVPKPR